MKSKLNACPICGKPRGKGPYEFAHGPCYEMRAKTEGKKSAGLPGPLKTITVEQKEKTRSNSHAKKYLSGDLREWMYR